MLWFLITLVNTVMLTVCVYVVTLVFWVHIVMCVVLVRAVYNCGFTRLCWSLCNYCIVLYCAYNYGTSCCTPYLYRLCSVTVSRSVS